MNRRNFIKTLAALPFVGVFFGGCREELCRIDVKKKQESKPYLHTSPVTEPFDGVVLFSGGCDIPNCRVALQFSNDMVSWIDDAVFKDEHALSFLVQKKPLSRYWRTLCTLSDGNIVDSDWWDMKLVL